VCPLRPELLAIGANDPYVRIYDRRMLSLQKAIEGEEGGGSLASWDRYPIPHWPLPAVRDLTRDGRLSTGTYDESVLNLSNVSFRVKCARMGHPLKLPSPTKLARLGHFPPASQAGCLAGPVFYTRYFLWVFLLYSIWNHVYCKACRNRYARRPTFTEQKICIGLLLTVLCFGQKRNS
jgi:hypothetical protein